MYLCIYLSTVYLFIYSFIYLFMYLSKSYLLIYSFIYFVYLHMNLYHANILFKDSFVSIPIVSLCSSLLKLNSKFKYHKVIF